MNRGAVRIYTLFQELLARSFLVSRTSARTTYAKSAWHDLKSRWQKTGEFTIKFKSDALVFIDGTRRNLCSQRMLNFRHTQMRTEI